MRRSCDRCLIPLLTGCSGLYRQNSAVCRGQVLASRALQQLRCNLTEVLFDAVYAPGIVVKERKGRKQINAADPAKSAQTVVEAGPQFDEGSVNSLPVNRVVLDAGYDIIRRRQNLVGTALVIVNEAKNSEHRAVVIKHIAKKGIDTAAYACRIAAMVD